MSISEQIERLQQAKADFKTKFAEKGIDLGDKLISEYPNYIDAISDNGGTGTTLKKLINYTQSCRNMFRDNENITDLTNYIEYNDTASANDMSYMFYKCFNLTTIPQLNTSNVTNMNSMFTNVENIKEIPRLDTSKVINMDNMFQNCYFLEKVDLSYFNCEDVSYMFNKCISLKTIIIRGFGEYFSIKANSFTRCERLTGEVSNDNPNGLKDGYIYVPRNMVDTLKSADVWSDYATQIRALEDYTIDGTINGDLDESKI